MSELICPGCGQRLERLTRFCPECGAQLPGAQAAATVRLADEPTATPAETSPPPTSSAPLAADDHPPTRQPDLPTQNDGMQPPPPLAASAPTSNRRLLWWLLGGFGCLSLLFFGACATIGVLTLLGQRVTERATESATPVPVQSSDAPRNDTNAANGEVLLEDDFSDTLTSDLDVSEDETSRSAYEDGAYVVEVKVPEMVVWSLVGGPYSDVSVEVDVEIPTGSDVTAAGVIFHYQDNNNFYLFSASNDGYYQLELLQNGEWIMLIDPTYSDRFEKSRTTLRVETRGSRIALYADGELLEETSDTTFSSGDAGLAVSTFEQSTGTVRFDNLIIVRAE